MNKLLDVLVVVVVVIFATLLVLTVMKTCGKKAPEKKTPTLESSVQMGAEETERDTTEPENETKAWDEDIERNDTAKMEADGISPEDIENLDPELASKISEYGDDGIKKEKEKKAENSGLSPENEAKINIGPEADVFFVIAGSFKDPTNAANLVKQLNKFGYPAEIVQFLNNNLKSVSVQRFGSKNDAAKLVGELKTKHKIDSYVVKKKN